MRHELSQAKRKGEEAAEGTPLAESRMIERTDICYECKASGVRRAVVRGPNGISGSPEWGKKKIGGGRPVTVEAAETEEDPQAGGAQLKVEATRDEVEEMRRVANALGRREAEGPGESEYPIDESVVTPCGREASEVAESSHGFILWNVGSTAILRGDVAGSQGEALLDTDASKTFIS
ncbi:hypothetical protein EPH_0029770 [Eimeria praecox]|uniref:Uncharacterized protein n=1 Tax=Eimeria praecox TaxID=51316 RepID=U6H8F9_9EIME|nr:hypothetical protein EPH_0029770 [Eimeria praecox]